MDTDLNATEKNTAEEDTVNEKTKDSSKGINYDTSIDNGVGGSVIYDKFK